MFVTREKYSRGEVGGIKAVSKLYMNKSPQRYKSTSERLNV